MCSYIRVQRMASGELLWAGFFNSQVDMPKIGKMLFFLIKNIRAFFRIQL